VFYDQRENTALVFGIAPSGTTKVVVADSGGAQSTAKLASARSSAVFVVSMAIAHTATALTAYGRGQRLLEACNERRCVAP
jgi:predicted PP-loop superfamily ATPase